MRKSEIIAALERMPGDPEIQVKVICDDEKFICPRCDFMKSSPTLSHLIDRINEYPRPEIVVIEK